MRLLALSLAILWLLAPGALAQSERRVALVLGNSAYMATPALPNPRRDAEAVATALERLGFEVVRGLDLDMAGMRGAVRDYAGRLEEADVALFYYAGHGMQVNGENYLVPIDAEIGSEADLDFATVPMQLILAQMERWAPVKILILDACRDNPFLTALRRSMNATRATRSLGRGLAQIQTVGGTFLAYATDPGDVALDGAGAHSPFTAALLEHVATPGVDIHTMMARVRADVFAATDQRQRPWTESSLIGEFFLAPPEPEPPAPVQVMAPSPLPPAAPAPPQGERIDPREIELAVWAAAQAGGTAEDYAEYLRQYPDGIFATLARNRLAALAKPDAGDAQGAAPGAAAEPPAAVDAPAQDEAVTLPEAGAPEGTPDAPPSATVSPDPAPDPAPGPEAGPGPEPQEAVEAALALDRARRREMQMRLLVAGHDPRGIDGIFGPGTRAAISAWQTEEGLEPTGYLDAAAVDLLERRTEDGYDTYVARQREAEAARRAAAARARAERQATERPPAEAAVAAEARDTAPPDAVPTAEAPTSAAPAGAADAGMDDRPVRERYEEKCRFVFVGKPQLERRCD